MVQAQAQAETDSRLTSLEYNLNKLVEALSKQTGVKAKAKPRKKSPPKTPPAVQ